jgi:hypothetical protein
MKLKTKKLGSIEVCADCEGIIITDYTWLGEDSEGRGKTLHHDECEDCGNRRTIEVIGG